MSDARVRRISECAREASVDAAWRQWARLGASALHDAAAEAQAIVDPEALLLGALYLEPVERRLGDFAYWWAEVGSTLLSVQRTKTLLKRFPPATKTRLGGFARRAVAAGDKRWRRYAADDPEAETKQDAPGRPGKGADHPRLRSSPALVLRLRAGFGVSAKADVLAYLLGIDERAASVQETADATAYSRATVGGVLSDMARAGFIRETGHRSARYVAAVRPWAPLLEFESRDAGANGLVRAPAWRYWSDLFAFLAQTARWAEDADGTSDYLLSSRARDLYEEHQPAFENNRIDVPRPDAYRGAAYLDGFEKTVDALAQWMSDHL